MSENVRAIIEEPFPVPERPAPGEHLEVGRRGEALARKFLWKKGLRIIGFNVKTDAGEIDIVGERRGRLHFVEVKTRTSDSLGEPELRVDSDKRRRLRASAAAYLREYIDPPSDGTQFDVVSVVLKTDKKQVLEIRWLQEAF